MPKVVGTDFPKAGICWEEIARSRLHQIRRGSSIPILQKSTHTHTHRERHREERDEPGTPHARDEYHGTGPGSRPAVVRALC